MTQLKNLLVGNGINCQFDHTSYTSSQIVLRILKNCARLDFPSDIIVDSPLLLKDYLGTLFLNARKVIAGHYDVFALSPAEKESLYAFKDQYSARIVHLKMTDICFEDYYLLHDLTCHSIQIGNPDQYTVREAMRVAYLYAIYNDGKINELYRKYPSHVIDFLQHHDYIFTTNYDLNLEKATGKSVNHLHGQFDRLSDVYNEESLRNHLPDCPIKGYNINPRYLYLYSNAITTHSGSYKEFYITQTTTANATIQKMANAYSTDPKIKEQVDTWLTCSNTLVNNLGHAIVIKALNPELCFTEQYDFVSFERMSGELDILGLSPWNDFHIFRAINNSSIHNCTFYYYDKNDCEKVAELLPLLSTEGRLIFKSADEIWEKKHAEE